MEALPQMPADLRRHQLVRALREAIITGGLRPGDRLVERDISERVGVSRGPVREALRQLEQEGLVVSFPYRGTEVTSVSREEVEHLLVPMRLTLESFAFRHALPRMVEEDFERLGEMVASMREAATNGNLARIVDADVRFHELIFDRAGQPHCSQVWRTIVPRVRSYFYRDARVYRSLEDLAESHDGLLQAMRSRDMERVQPVLDKHIRETVQLDGEGGEGEQPASPSTGGEDGREPTRF